MRNRSSSTQVDAGRVCVARQPILDRNRNIFGYDLSFQALPGAGPDTAPADYATARVISDGILAIGLDNLVESADDIKPILRHDPPEVALAQRR